MDKSIKKTIEVLNDLIRINHDRIKAYKQAEEKLTDDEADLKFVFDDIIEQCKNFFAELTTELMAHGEEPGYQEHRAGCLYRDWMNISLYFKGTERPDILDFCEYVEDAMLTIYDGAIIQDAITETALSLFGKQKQDLLVAYQKIKQLKGKELAYYN